MRFNSLKNNVPCAAIYYVRALLLFLSNRVVYLRANLLKYERITRFNRYRCIERMEISAPDVVSGYGPRNIREKTFAPLPPAPLVLLPRTCLIVSIPAPPVSGVRDTNGRIIRRELNKRVGMRSAGNPMTTLVF